MDLKIWKGPAPFQLLAHYTARCPSPSNLLMDVSEYHRSGIVDGLSWTPVQVRSCLHCRTEGVSDHQVLHISCALHFQAFLPAMS